MDDQSTIRLREVHFTRPIVYGPSGSGRSAQAVDNGEGNVRIDLLGFHTVMVTSKGGRGALVSWAGCHGREWADCEVNGCVLPKHHKDELSKKHTDKEGKEMVEKLVVAGVATKAAALLIGLSLLAAPAFAGDASTDAKVSQPSMPVTLCVTAEAQWDTPKGTVKPKGVKCPAAFPRQDTMQIRAPGNVVVLSAICCPPQPPKAVK